MKKIVLFFVITLAPLFAMNDSMPVQVGTCAQCHSLEHPSVADKSQFKAPSMVTIMTNVKFKHRAKVDQIKFLKDYVNDPQNTTPVLCQRHSVDKFNKMPKQNLSSKDLNIIINFLVNKYNLNKPYCKLDHKLIGCNKK